ncbi:NYN domain-containing protein [Candidatus Woesearchaeota archaeon]|nr:NYN domain-containing protein [Candidatus Woesearchaeota archaeon]
MLLVQHREQRIGVFVDVQNMYYSAKSLYGRKINFANILRTAVADRQLIRAIAYVIKTAERDKEHFYEGLEKLGYELRAKELQIFYGGAKKGDWDVGIAMDVMRLAAKLDVIVLVSGDGDFQDLLEHAKALGCRTEVIAFGKSCSSRLKEAAHMIVDMDKEPNKFLLGKMPTPSSPSGGQPREKATDEKLVPIELKGEAPKEGASPRQGPRQERRGRRPQRQPHPPSEPRPPQLTDDFFER